MNATTMGITTVMRGILHAMKWRTDNLRRCLALMCVVSLAPAVWAVPIGYRYIGSRIVSDGRIVYWYWNVDHVEIGPYNVNFVARMYARAVDVNQERPYTAEIRCDSRTYRPYGSQNQYETIDDGEPIHAVWRAGCDAGKAVPLAVRYARLNAGAPTAATGAASEAGRSPTASMPTPAESDRRNLVAAAAAPPAATPPAKGGAATPTRDANEERRVDRCVRFAEGKTSQFGDAMVTNTCNFAIEVTLCYKGGGGGIYDCPPRPKGMRMETLAPGATHNLPEYRRDRHKGIASVACRGTMGTVMPLLNGDGGKTGCY